MCLAIPGKIISVRDDEPLMRMGRVSFSGVIKDISLALVPEANVDDYVIVHAGFAISIIDEQEANKTFDYLTEMGMLNRSGENGS